MYVLATLRFQTSIISNLNVALQYFATKFLFIGRLSHMWSENSWWFYEKIWKIWISEFVCDGGINIHGHQNWCIPEVFSLTYFTHLKKNGASLMKLKSHQFWGIFCSERGVFKKKYECLVAPFCVTHHCISTVQDLQMDLTFPRVSQVSDKF